MLEEESQETPTFVEVKSMILSDIRFGRVGRHVE
jgi:hypothetical protein